MSWALHARLENVRKNARLLKVAQVVFVDHPAGPHFVLQQAQTVQRLDGGRHLVVGDRRVRRPQGIGEPGQRATALGQQVEESRDGPFRVPELDGLARVEDDLHTPGVRCHPTCLSLGRIAPPPD